MSSSKTIYLYAQGGDYLSEAQNPTPLPPHAVHLYTVCTYSHRKGEEGGELNYTRTQKVRGAIVQKLGRKYQHD
jgi:hypothetical protein